jgi:hypothetical protein
VIEEIIKLMLGSVETVGKEKLSRRKEAATTAQKQQQQQRDGADEQLQKKFWDPGGFPQLRVEAHEQELMNFVAEEYDAGESLHISQPCNQPHQCMHSKLKRGATLIFHFEFECNLMFRLLSHEVMPLHRH